MKTRLLLLLFAYITSFTYGQITFSYFNIDNLEATANAANSVAAADFDGDGDIDVVGAAFQADIFSVYINDGDGNFTQQTIDNSPATADGARFVTTVDLDDDGDMDVLAASSTADVYVWYENDGSATFTTNIIDNSGLASEAYSIDAADFDQDGDMDIVGGANSGNAVAVYSNDGDENFTLLTDLSGGAPTDGVRALKAVDLDIDGDMDILVAANSSDTYSWFENDGSGVFTNNIIDNTEANTNGASQVMAADMDGDGDMDVVAGSNLADRYVWYENDGSQNFTAQIIDQATYANGPRGIGLVDLEQDGDMDVLVASITQDVFAWYENDGAGNFTPALISNDPLNANGAFAITAADIDGDMVDDIITAANISDAFSWFRTEGVVLSIADNELGEISLYPVPVKSDLFIKLPASISVSNVSVYDALGRMVINMENSAANEMVLDMDSLSSGFYLVRATTNNGDFVKRILKE
ncbi:MAG TPA: T9SS type A sorting domain-containing protein [Aequorivita sp.]|nr:T9SS type A sorting domain-containing protein [Aequorivita sp.]